MAARILIIEDDPNTLELARYLLSAAGHTCLSATSGEAGLALAREQRPDLIVCDIQLPGLDGLGVAEALASDRDLAGIPLVAVTALAMVGDRAKILAAGFDGYISKPVSPEKFALQLDRFLPPGLRVGTEPVRDRPAEVTVLIVDDSRSNREYLASLLQYRRYRTLQAADGVEALRWLGTEPVDLVISDVLMPRMNGYEFVRQLRNDARTASLPVIFYTTHFQKRDAQDLARFSGVSIVLPKPSMPHEVLRAVDEALTGKFESADLHENFDAQHLKLLNEKLVETVRELEQRTSHLGTLIQMNLQLASERAPKRLLGGFAKAVRELVQASHVVVAVNAADGGPFRHATVSGMDLQQAASVERAVLRQGTFPAPAGSDAPIRRRCEGDPVSVGLPAEHPRVHSLLVAPIRSPEHAYGWVVATGRIDLEEFSPEDEQLVSVFATQLGRIYENASLYADLERRTRELEAEVQERRRTESALRRSEENFRHLFDNSPLPMWVYDKSRLGYLEVNEVAIARYGYSREEFLSMGLADIWPPGDAVRLRRTVFDTTGDYLHVTDSRHRYKDGTIVDVEIFAHDIVFQGKPARLGLVIDVTQRKEIERQLIQSQKMEAVGQLTGGVAHDLNNILMIILANVDALDEEGTFEPAHKQRVRNIGNATQRAAALTRQLLAFSRKQALRPRVADINDLVASTGELLRRTLGEQIEIDALLADGLWMTEVDTSQLQTALVNLCLNARDAMPNGGRLLVQTSNATLDADYAARNADVTAGDYVLLSVTDTGTGMPPETARRVFEPFFTTKEAGKGTGLGLSMVYGFIKQSRGHISIYSEVGVGTTVRIYLRRSMASSAQAADTSVAIVGGTERVLIVEDNEDVRGAVVEQLTKLGYRVSAAHDGASALAILAAAPDPFDLVLTDVILPGMGGRPLADEIAVRWPAIAILFMSGYPGSAVLQTGTLEAGTNFLPKPFRKIDLAQAVRRILDGVDA